MNKLKDNKKNMFFDKCENKINNTKLQECCKCNFDSQIAYIVNKINDNIDDIDDIDDDNNNNDDNIDDKKDLIFVIDYLKNNKLIKKINTKKKYLVCEKGKEIIVCKSDIKKSYFRHKYDTLDNAMTEWHKNWQSKFDVIEKKIGNRWADAVCNKHVLEFQHSEIKKSLVDIRIKNYKDNGYEILWIVDGNDKIDFCSFGEKTILKFKKEWLYKSFIDCDNIYVDYKDTIFNINPKYVKGKQILVGENKNKQDFINEILKNKIKWGECFEYTGKIYQNQRGAGCGKTYESVQLITKKEFENKTQFIFLTKLSSAVSVIKKEINDLMKKINENKHLKFDLKIKNFIEKKVFDYETKKPSNKKFEFECERDGKQTTILLGTIDSFTMSVHSGKINKSAIDIFQDTVISISNGNIKKDMSFRKKKVGMRIRTKKNTLPI